MLLEDGKLKKGVVFFLFDFYNDVIDGVEFGVGRGLCGNIVVMNLLIIVEDISMYFFWIDWKDLVLCVGVCFCWL